MFHHVYRLGFCTNLVCSSSNVLMFPLNCRVFPFYSAPWTSQGSTNETYTCKGRKQGEFILSCEKRSSREKKSTEPNMCSIYKSLSICSCQHRINFSLHFLSLSLLFSFIDQPRYSLCVCYFLLSYLLCSEMKTKGIYTIASTHTLYRTCFQHSPQALFANKICQEWHTNRLR